MSAANDAPAPLHGMHVLLIALNVPGPVAASQLQSLGAHVTKIEPAHGDPFARMCPGWYAQLHDSIDVRRLDLKRADAREECDALLASADVLLTSFRPSSLARMGLDHELLRTRYPRLCHVAIVGERGARAEHAGHDLTYQAGAGLLDPGAMPRSLPRTLVADLSGAERAVSASLALLLARARENQKASDGTSPPTHRYTEVALADGAEEFAAPIRFGLTSADGLLGGSNPWYRVYRASDGWLALAALEPQFQERFVRLLQVDSPTEATLSGIFAAQSIAQWTQWASEHDMPIAEVRDP